MGTIELREELHKYIDKADEAFLKMVYARSKEKKQSVVAGYTPDGKPISQKDLRNRVLTASKRVKDGDFISQEEIEKEVENW